MAHEVCGIPRTQLPKDELSRIWVDVNGADLKGWTKWCHNVISAVECKTENEHQGCMSQRRSERVGVEGVVINFSACATWA